MRRTTAPQGLHRQVQGQVRRRLRGVPRVGAAAHDREGHPAEGHRSSRRSTRCRTTWRTRATCVRPWDTLNADEKKLFSRLMEVYAGFSEYTDAQVGPHHRLPREDRPARQHRRPLRRRQRRVRRRQPERLGQREQVLQRLSGRAGREPEAHRRARRTGHLRALSRPAGPPPPRRRSRCSSATRNTPAAPAIRW